MGVEVASHIPVAIIRMEKRVTGGPSDPAAMWNRHLGRQRELSARVVNVACSVVHAFDAAAGKFDCLAGKSFEGLAPCLRG